MDKIVSNKIEVEEWYTKESGIVYRHIKFPNGEVMKLTTPYDDLPYLIYKTPKVGNIKKFKMLYGHKLLPERGCPHCSCPVCHHCGKAKEDKNHG